MADPTGDNLMEEREETMVSPRGGDPFRKTAHFLKPSIGSTHLLPPLSKALTFDARDNTPLKVTLKGSQYPSRNWKKWVDLLLPKYQNTWKRAGIYESILISTYKITSYDDIVIALAERWCFETNTFIFPWGESTVTLEDMMVLGGYSVWGEPVWSPLSSDGMRKIVEDLIKAIRKIEMIMGKSQNNNVWMTYFMNKRHRLEHEAFLALWLSWFVFPLTHPKVGEFVFPIAVHLSRGTRLALAPAVLAGIYRDLGLLKKSLLSCLTRESLGTDEVKITLFAPLKFVQVWAWERFPVLRPTPISTRVPLLSRWDKVKKSRAGDPRKILDFAGDCFQWRPYATFVDNLGFNKLLREQKGWIMVESGRDNEIEMYAMCVRPSELVGLGFVEQYLPHRVAMQFGLDQDIPAFAPRSNDSPELAWSNYTRPIEGKKIYIPARLYESDVTVHYSTWWNRAMSAKEDKIKSFARRPRSQKRKRAPLACRGLNYKGDSKGDPLTMDEILDSPKNCSAIINDIENNNSNSGEVDPLMVDVNAHSPQINIAIINGMDQNSTGGEVDPFPVDDNADGPNTHSATINNSANINPTSGEVVMSGLDLETRISRLELLIAMLKEGKIA